MYTIFLQGLLFGLAYVMPIGMQNIYIINSAMQKNRRIIIFTTAVVIFFDISLAVGCYFGVGVLLDRYVFLREIVMLLGSIIIFYIAYGLWRSDSDFKITANSNHSLIKIISAAFSVAWLNPQAVIDGSLLLGSFRTTLSADNSVYFLLGVCIASCIWFSFLSFIAHKFIEKFRKLAKYINLSCAVILFLYGVKLLYTFLSEIIHCSFFF